MLRLVITQDNEKEKYCIYPKKISWLIDGTAGVYIVLLSACGVLYV
jgi:hypothetical protein